MKTIKTWFNQLEKPYKSQAIANTDFNLSTATATCLSDALSSAFIWADTKEGYDYWYQLNERLLNENR